MLESEPKLQISTKSVVVIIPITLLPSCTGNLWIPFCFIISAASQTVSSGPIMVKGADITSDRGVKRALFFDAIFFAKLESDSREKLDEILTNNIRKIPKIRSTNTLSPILSQGGR